MMIGVLLAIVLFSAQERTVDPATELAAARALYASAAYEDALGRLGRLNGPEGLRDEIDTYRALCLLALGRNRESERVLEQIIERNPRFALDEDKVSPRLVIAFRAVRSRMLPAAARSLYASARTSFDSRQYDASVRQLKELLALIGPDPEESGLSDLKVLAEGFLKLAESAEAAAKAASAPAAPPPPAPAPLPPVPALESAAQRSITWTSAVTPGPVFSNLDRGVTAPVEISRPVPIWEAPPGTMAGVYQGLIEVVINDQGRVESAVMRRSISASFDAELLTATGRWRFQPAMRQGQPVKYRRSYEVIGHSR